MSPFTHFHDSVALSIGWMLIHSSWLGTLIAAIAAVTSLAMRKASARHRCTLLFVMLVAIPVSAVAWQLVVEREKMTLIVQSHARPEPPVASLRPSAPKHVDVERRNVVQPDRTHDHELAPATSQAVPSQWVLRQQLSGFATWITPWLPWLVLAWMVGVLLLSARMMVGCVTLRKLCRAGTAPVSSDIVGTVDALAKQLRIQGGVRVMQSGLTQVPTTIGFLCPIILLPLSVLSNLSAKEMESILAHELAHIHRRDFLMNIIQTVLEVVMFYHPAVWWLSHRIRYERELACDDLAIQVAGDRTRYARALAEVALCARQHRLAMSARGGQVSKRIRRVLGHSRPSSLSAMHLMSVSTLLILICAVTTLLVNAGQTAPELDRQIPASDATAQDATSIDGRVLKTIAGQILGADGKPLADAKVFLRRRPFPLNDELELAEQVTGADGRFEFREVPLPTSAKPAARFFPLDIIAMKPRHSIRWKRISNERVDIRLQLRKESVLQGKLEDDRGQPVEGATIRVHNLMSLNTIRKIDTANGHTPSANGESFLDIARANANISAKTAADGSFVLRQLPRRVGLVLATQDRRLLVTKWYAATTTEELPNIPAGRPIPQPQPATPEEILRYQRRVEMLKIHRTPAELVASRGVQVRFHVTHGVTGKSVEGAALAIAGSSRPPVLTDSDGYALVAQLRPDAQHQVKVNAPDEESLLATTVIVPQTSDLEREQEVLLRPGAVVAGKVVERDSRTGVESATVSFVPQGATAIVSSPTAKDGSFRFVVPNLPGHLDVVRVPAGYLPPINRGAVAGSAPIQPRLDAAISDLILEVDRRPSISFRFVDMEGPVAASVDLRVYRTSNSLITVNVKVDTTGQLDAGRYVRGSEVPYAIQLLARSVDDRLAAFFREENVDELQEAESPQVITLRPVVST